MLRVHVGRQRNTEQCIEILKQCLARSKSARRMQTGPSAAALPERKKGVARKLRPFCTPLRADPDIKGSTTRRRQDVKGFHYSPLCPSAQAVFAQHALFWNRGMFPRIEAQSAERPGKKRQSTLVEVRLLAVLVLQHGRNSEVRSATRHIVAVFLLSALTHELFRTSMDHHAVCVSQAPGLRLENVPHLQC